jgi:hypothetical protein
MNQKIEKIKAAVIALKRGAGRPRYPEEIKSAVRDLYRGGMGMAELTNQTGISHGALFAWLRSSAKRKFHAVKVGASLAPVVPLRVVLPSGIFIECASLEVLQGVLEITK